MPFKWKKPRPRPPITAFFVLLGLVGTLLLVTVAMQRGAAPRTSVAEQLPPPDFSAFLPAGVDAASLAVMTLEGVPQPWYVIGYSNDGQGELAVVKWDIRENRYQRASRIPLISPQVRLTSVSSIMREPLGTGAPALILARGPHGGAYTEAVIPLMQEGDRIRFVAMRNEDGTSGVAYFLEGVSARDIREFSLEDLTGDGVKEAVATFSTVDERGAKTSELTVYVWKEGYLTYDKELSWAYTTSRNLFPEPQAQ